MSHDEKTCINCGEGIGRVSDKATTAEDLGHVPPISPTTLRRAANDLIDAISIPAGRDFEHAWEHACLIFGRFGAKPTLLTRERLCSCQCSRCEAPPFEHGCGSKECNGPARWDRPSEATPVDEKPVCDRCGEEDSDERIMGKVNVCELCSASDAYRVEQLTFILQRFIDGGTRGDLMTACENAGLTPKVRASAEATPFPCENCGVPFIGIVCKNPACPGHPAEVLALADQEAARIEREHQVTGESPECSDCTKLIAYCDAAKIEAQKRGRVSGEPLADWIRRLPIDIDRDVHEALAWCQEMKVAIDCTDGLWTVESFVGDRLVAGLAYESLVLAVVSAKEKRAEAIASPVVDIVRRRERAQDPKEAFRAGWAAAIDFSQGSHETFESAWTAHCARVEQQTSSDKQAEQVVSPAPAVFTSTPARGSEEAGTINPSERCVFEQGGDRCAHRAGHKGNHGIKGIGTFSAADLSRIGTPRVSGDHIRTDGTSTENIKVIDLAADSSSNGEKP